MKISYLFLIPVFLFNISLSAQKLDKITSKKPISIYTFSKISVDKNGISSINKKLSLNNFNFVFVDVIDLDLNQFSIDTKYVYKKTSEFIYDDFNRYQNRNLLKGFLIKNDPTRWNLQYRKSNL